MTKFPKYDIIFIENKERGIKIKILSAKIVLKNGRVVKSKSLVKDNETKKLSRVFKRRTCERSDG